MLYKFVQLLVLTNYATLLNCTLREGYINVGGPEYGSLVPGKGPGSKFFCMLVCRPAGLQGRVATCARKPKVPGSSLAASYVQR